jgi:hypothetical protein
LGYRINSLGLNKDRVLLIAKDMEAWKNFPARLTALRLKPFSGSVGESVTAWLYAEERAMDAVDG